MRELRGTVFDGSGAAKEFTQLDWVRRQFQTKIGFDPHPGTLNLRVDDVAALVALKACPSIPISPDSTGACPARAWRVQVGGSMEAAWILPEVPGYPTDVIELMAPVSLRKTLGLKTGDIVTIAFFNPIEPANDLNEE